MIKYNNSVFPVRISLRYNIRLTRHSHTHKLLVRKKLDFRSLGLGV